jgi:hypothetical protein
LFYYFLNLSFFTNNGNQHSYFKNFRKRQNSFVKKTVLIHIAFYFLNFDVQFSDVNVCKQFFKLNNLWWKLFGWKKTSAWGHWYASEGRKKARNALEENLKLHPPNAGQALRKSRHGSVIRPAKKASSLTTGMSKLCTKYLFVKLLKSV